ncbi:MAG TPA: NAD(+)/NADH kinase [Clostridiaceae bacterium]|nr:NAD(+)/NADH kinase [Clostridiaceae bacterium]
MLFALYPNIKRDPELKWTKRLIDAIESQDCLACIDSGLIPHFEYSNLQWGRPCKPDFVVSLGGDGTFLSSMALPGLEETPRAGVNLGTVGFLQEIMPEQIEERVENLCAGNYRLQRRTMFKADCYDKYGKLFAQTEALNDVILIRGATSRIIKIDLFINEGKVERIPGDGVIVSTATGSTAYSLSCGGPIVHPDLDIMLITPICPHTLHNRSYITDSSSNVRLQLAENSRSATVSVDGRIEIPLRKGGYVVVYLSDKSVSYILFDEYDFYETLPLKIQKRGTSQ